MKGNNRLLVIGVMLATIAGASVWAATGFAIEQDFSGTGIEAAIAFVDTEAGLEVRGVASGLDPSKTFFTLMYDPDSVAVGPAACTPSGPDEPVATAGFWQVNADGTATLQGLVDSELAAHGTASIRVLSPGKAVLKACGEIVERPFQLIPGAGGGVIIRN